MRKAALTALLVLAGCQQAADAPAPRPTETVASRSVAAAAPISIPLPSATPPPRAAATSGPPKHFQALGTEPFWSVETLPGKLRYASPEQPNGVTFAVTFGQSGARSRYIGTMSGAAVALTIAPGKCTDGMSDRSYPYTAALTIGDHAMRGCARVK